MTGVYAHEYDFIQSVKGVSFLFLDEARCRVHAENGAVNSLECLRNEFRGQRMVSGRSVAANLSAGFGIPSRCGTKW